MNFIKGLLVGFAGGFFVGKKHGQNVKAREELYQAALDYRDSVRNFEESLQPFDGKTTDEKYENFLEKLRRTDFSNLERPRKRV